MQRLKQNGSPTLAGIWSTYRSRILSTMSLLTAERVFAIAIPFALGVAINDLVAGSLRGLLLLGGLQVAVLGIGVTRRLYDTRVYARIYTDVAWQQAGKQHLPVSKRAARLQHLPHLIFYPLNSQRQ